MLLVKKLRMILILVNHIIHYDYKAQQTGFVPALCRQSYG